MQQRQGSSHVEKETKNRNGEPAAPLLFLPLQNHEPSALQMNGPRLHLCTTTTIE